MTPCLLGLLSWNMALKLISPHSFDCILLKTFGRSILGLMLIAMPSLVMGVGLTILGGNLLGFSISLLFACITFPRLPLFITSVKRDKKQQSMSDPHFHGSNRFLNSHTILLFLACSIWGGQGLYQCLAFLCMKVCMK